MSKYDYPKETSTIYIRDVPVDLHAHFKKKCAGRHIPMRTVILDFMRKYIKADPLKGDKVL